MNHHPLLAGASTLAVCRHLPAFVLGVSFPHSYNDFLTPTASTTSGGEDLALSELKLQLNRYGQTLSSSQWRGLSDVVGTLNAMLNGACPPKIHLSSLDPGMGKTTALIQFIKEVTRSPDHGHDGVIVFLSRKDEIARLVEEADLHTDHFAVLTADDACNALSSTPVDSAQVLFTTQQMLTHRCKGDSFTRCEAFFYLSRPRSVRVWDETLAPGEVVALSSDDLGALLPFLRRATTKIADQVQDLHGRLITTNHGTVITMPVFEGLTRLGSGEDGGDVLNRNLDALAAMSGQPVRVFSGQGKQMIALNIRDALPTDMAPLLVLDASGSVRETYRCWERYRGGLTRLASARKDYSALDVQVLDQGAAKDSWRENGERLAIEVAAVIDSKPDEPFVDD